MDIVVLSLKRYLTAIEIIIRMFTHLIAMSMRIDDPHNGCWLPNDWEGRPHMPNYLRKAVPHWRIHTDNYYRLR